MDTLFAMAQARSNTCNVLGGLQSVFNVACWSVQCIHLHWGIPHYLEWEIFVSTKFHESSRMTPEQNKNGCATSVPMYMYMYAI